ncbi:hypothetical protein PTKIN_Ptkin13bG0216100 [Pterospermum kingtungense]
MVKWVRPSSGFIKCNVDASLSQASKSIGFAIGLLEALSWIKELGMHNVYFELDALTVVNVINSHHGDISEFGSIFGSCKNLLH